MLTPRRMPLGHDGSGPTPSEGMGNVLRRAKSEFDAAASLPEWEFDAQPHSPLRRVVHAACAVLIVIAVLPYLPPLAPHRWPNPWRLGVIALLALAEAGLFALAARRRALGDRLRQSMAMFGVALALVAISDALVIAMRLPTTGPALSRINDFLELLYTGLGIVALFWMPLARVRGLGRWLVLTDITIAVTGMALVVLATTTLVALGTARMTEYSRILQYGVTTALTLAALNTILVRGLVRRVGYGIWFLAATAVLEVLYWVIVQLRLAHPAVDGRAIDIVFACDQVCYMLAAVSFLTAAVEDHADRLAERERLRWMSTFNPLPVISAGAVSALLLALAFNRPTAIDFRVVSVGMVLVTGLLLLRVILGAQDRVALVRDEATTVARLQQERVTALRRIAGGVAHEFNNLMTIVMGNAEFGEADAADLPPLAAYFQTIHAAAVRAALLTGRLRAYASGDPIRRTLTPLDELVNALRPSILERAGDRIAVEFKIDPVIPPVLAHAKLLEVAILHLVANSVAAMPGGGRLMIALSRRQVKAEEFVDAILAGVPADYVELAVTDTGGGIAPEDVRRVFDPFFSTHSLAVAPGLGLAVVHGTIAAHNGAITIRSSAEDGTVVRLYLPVSTSEARQGAVPLRMHKL